MKPKFGMVETKQVIDTDGSTVTTTEKLRKGIVNPPVRRYYEMRKRVASEKDEFEEYAEFSLDIRNDKSMIEPAFRIERSKVGDLEGYYYVVRCYTRLEY